MPQKASAWHRRDDETDKSWAAFQQYLLLGAERSLSKLNAAMGRKDSYLRWLKVWSSKYDWVARASAYDAEIGRQVLEDNKDESAKALERQAKQARAFQDAASTPALFVLKEFGGLEGVLKALKKEDVTAKEALYLIGNISPAWARAADIERKALGEPEHTVEFSTAEESRRVFRKVFDVDDEEEGG